MGNGGSSDRGERQGKTFTEHVGVCVVKNTINGNGTRGLYGDLATVGCIAGSIAKEHVVAKVREINDKK